MVVLEHPHERRLKLHVRTVVDYGASHGESQRVQRRQHELRKCRKDETRCLEVAVAVDIGVPQRLMADLRDGLGVPAKAKPALDDCNEQGYDDLAAIRAPA